MWSPAGDERARSRYELDDLFRDPHLELSVDDEERLVEAGMYVQRRAGEIRRAVYPHTSWLAVAALITIRLPALP